MKILACFFAVTLVVFLAGCASAPWPVEYVEDWPAERFADASVVSVDDYTKVASVVGHKLAMHEPTYDLGVSLAAAWDAEGIFYKLRVVYGARDWAFLEQAVDREGQALDLKVVDRVVGSGVEEYLAIDFSREYLEGALTSGLDLRIYGKRGHVDVKVPAPYVEGFLVRVASEFDRIEVGKVQ